MKRLTIVASLLVVTLAPQARAHWAAGTIYCDANQNGIIDSADSGIPSVLVVVTNLSGTYSNANWSMPDGQFIVQLPESVGDTFVEYLHPDTLPPDSGILLPIPPYYTFTITSNNITFTGDWLINNPDCQIHGGCWLTGGGTVGGTAKKPAHSFGGNVFPGCSSTAGEGGNWNHIAHYAKWHFRGTVVHTVRCGNVAGIDPGSESPITPFNLIEFEGTGSLTGIGGNKDSFDEVFFYARAEDRAEPGKKIDRYYLRVYTSDGTTRLLVSGDISNPTNIVTVPISTGNLQMHASGCD